MLNMKVCEVKTMRDRLIELKTQFVENFNCGNCKPEENK